MTPVRQRTGRFCVEGPQGVREAVRQAFPFHERHREVVLPLVLADLPRTVRRVVVADNGSTDGTARVAREGGAEVVAAPRRGYGSACLAGLDHLRRTGPPDVVVFVERREEPPTRRPRIVAVDRGDASAVRGVEAQRYGARQEVEARDQLLTQRLETRTGAGGDEQGSGSGSEKGVGARGRGQICLVQDEKGRLVSGSDLAQDFHDGVLTLLEVFGARKASTSPWGSFCTKPTVSTRRTSRAGPRRARRTRGSRVMKS